MARPDRRARPGRRSMFGRCRRRPAARNGRPEPARDGDPQPGGERARRHARRRHAAHHRRARDAWRRGQRRPGAGRLCLPLRRRYRDRMDEATLAARDRAVLLDQGDRQGHRPRPFDGAWPRRAARRRGPPSPASRGSAPTSSCGFRARTNGQAPGSGSIAGRCVDVSEREGPSGGRRGCRPRDHGRHACGNGLRDHPSAPRARKRWRSFARG